MGCRTRLMPSVVWAAIIASVALLGSFQAMGSPAARRSPLVVTSVAPLTNVVQNVAGTRAVVQGIIPDGTDSHTFEPAPSDARLLAQADLIILNGLSLEIPTENLALANKKSNTPILKLGDRTLGPEEWIYDFSFPVAEGNPNPHLWMNPLYAIRYSELVRDALSELDSGSAGYFDLNARRFRTRVEELDWAISAAVSTIPSDRRKLLTYHDSFAYFAPRYGLEVIGAIQPANFSEPSAREVAALIDQIRALSIPAIFGSEVFPSRVLEQIAREARVDYVDTLRDDDLPGARNAPEHTYVGMMVEDVQTIVRALGGDPSALDSIDPRNTYAE